MSEVPENNASESAETLGQKLKRLREQKGFTAQELADMLNLKHQAVEAIEADDIDNMPEGPFMRGYLRAWAKHLGADEAELLEGYEAIGGEQLAVKRAKPSEAGQGRNSLFLGTMLAILLAILGGLYWLWQSGTFDSWMEGVSDFIEEIKENRGKEEPLQLNNENKRGEITLPESLKELSIVPEAIPKNPVLVEEVQAVASEETTTIEVATSNTDVQATETANNSLAETGGQIIQKGNLVIKATDASSWLDVRDKFGTRLYVDLLPAGESKVFDGTPPYKIFIGYVPSISITFNGQAVDVAVHQKANNTARFSVGGESSAQ